MKTRGRDSVATRSVIAGGFAERPEPPKVLNRRQNAIWREVVASEDPNFFDSAVTRGLLADYCQRRAMAEEITKVIGDFPEDWADDPQSVSRREKFLRMRDRET